MRPCAKCLISIRILAIACAVSGCSPDYSPNTYGANAVQQANKVEQGVIVGVRRVDVAAGGAVGAASGAAAGGLVGAQTPGGSFGTAFGTVGGALVGGLVGSAAEHASADTSAFEYIVHKASNELVSVTQKDSTPLAVGQKVLVIAGNQARIVPDYTVAPADAGKDGAAKNGAAKDAKASLAPESGAGGTSGTAPHPDSVAATPLAPPPGASASPAAAAGAPPSISPAPAPPSLSPVAPPAPVPATSP